MTEKLILLSEKLYKSEPFFKGREIDFKIEFHNLSKAQKKNFLIYSFKRYDISFTISILLYLPCLWEKFETPQQLQKALNNTKPGTPTFNSTPVVNGRKTVIHELTDGTTYGKGVPKNGNTFQQAKKVIAGYEEVIPNNWQLITMFPDF